MLTIDPAAVRFPVPHNRIPPSNLWDNNATYFQQLKLQVFSVARVRTAQVERAPQAQGSATHTLFWQTGMIIQRD